MSSPSLQELNRLRQSGSGPVPQEAELRNRLQAAATEAKRRLDAFKSQLVLAEERDEVGSGGKVLHARDAFEALVALGVGAFLRDLPLDKALHKAAGFESARYKRQLLDCACAKRVFAFIEGALVTTWTGQVRGPMPPTTSHHPPDLTTGVTSNQGKVWRKLRPCIYVDM